MRLDRGRGAALPVDRLWNADYLKVLATNFCMSFAFYLVTPLLPIYLSEVFSASKDTIGAALSGYAAMAILARPITGWLVDCMPRKKVLLACLFFYFIFFGGYPLAESLAFFVVARTLHGLPFGAFTVANNTAVMDVLPMSRRNEGIGYYGLSNNVSTAIAPTVGVCIYSAFQDFDVLFLTALAVSFAGFVTGASIRMRGAPPAPPAPAAGSSMVERLFLLKGWPIGANMIFFGCCYGVLSNYLAIYGKEILGITGGTGLFFLILAAGLILSRLRGAKALRNGAFVRNAAQGILLSTCGYVLFIAAPNAAGYYGSALLIGLGNGRIWPALQNMILGVARGHEHGVATSTILTAWSLGIGLGIFLGGVSTEHMGYAATFWMVAALHALGGVLFFAVTRKCRRCGAPAGGIPPSA